jgi:hypothetical protein
VGEGITPMQIQPDVNTKELESKVIALQKSLAFVNDGSGTDSSELFSIIHRPGWTTLRAVNEASDLLSAMEQRGVELQALKRRLQQHNDAACLFCPNLSNCQALWK